MAVIYKILVTIITLIISISCTSKNIVVDEENLTICAEKKYNGTYQINLIRKCEDQYGPMKWGEANLEINKCILSVNDLYGALLEHEPDRVDKWKTLTGSVDKKGRISGKVYLKHLKNRNESKNLIFFGNINENKMVSKIQDCKFIFSLIKIKSEIKSKETSQNDKDLELEKSPTLIIPTGILGDISESQRIILEKTLESKIDNYFAIVPKDLFEEAQEKAFEELDYEECTEEQCIVKIQELLQVENAFKLLLVRDGNDTQISLTWNNLDEKRVEEVYCENCNTKILRESIEGIVEKLISNN